MVAVALFVASLALSSRALAFDTVLVALRRVRNFHMVETDASGQVRTESWQSGEKRRYVINLSAPGVKSDEGGRLERGYDGSHVWQVREANKSASIETGSPSGFGDANIPTVESMAADFSKSARGAVVSKCRRAGDNLIYELQGTSGVSKLVLTVDTSSRLPLKSEWFGKDKDGRWRVGVRQTFDYPVQFSDDTFAFRPPSNYTVYDFDRMIRDFDNNLAGAGAAQTVQGVTIRLLGAYKEEDGSVEVVWSGGACPPPLAVAGAFDSAGSSLSSDILIEGDDRARPKNHGIPPKDSPKPVPANQQVLVIRPLGWRQGTPFYGLRVFPKGSFEDRIAISTYSAATERNLPVDLTVVLPVCRPVAPFDARPKPGWMLHRVVGEQVGQATFKVTAQPVDRFFRLLLDLDPEHMPVLQDTAVTRPSPPK